MPEKYYPSEHLEPVFSIEADSLSEAFKKALDIAKKSSREPASIVNGVALVGAEAKLGDVKIRFLFKETYC